MIRRESGAKMAALSLLLVLFSSRTCTAFVFPSSPSHSSSSSASLLPKQLPFSSSSNTGTSRADTLLHVGRRTVGLDVDIIFGSANETGVNWGDAENEDEARNQRAKEVNELLEKDNLEFKQARKLKKWGKFANITTKEELEPLLQQEKDAIDAENQRKLALAQAAGVDFEVLEPKEETVFEDEDGGRIEIQGGAGPKSWFADMDEDLSSEWAALTGDAAADVKVEDASGQMVSRNAMAGIRVGSAGGWTLEVFPKDFVVHRKYGIGRFERTCLRPKTKLTAEEKKAKEDRRAEILTTELRKFTDGVTPDQIQAI
jgi:hypothetical protein